MVFETVDLSGKRVVFLSPSIFIAIGKRGELVSTQAELLAAVQEIDMQILRLEKELTDIPARKKTIEQANAHKQESLKSAKTLLASKQSATKQIELDVEAERQKIRKFREQQVQLKSNKEFKAMEDEIRQVEKKIGALEEKEIVSLEESDKVSVTVASIKHLMDKAEQEMRVELDGMDKRCADLDAKRQKLVAERTEKVVGVDPRWLNRYEAILKSKKDRALVRVDHKVCGGCNMALPPHVVHDARRGDLLLSCSFCGRLLY